MSGFVLIVAMALMHGSGDGGQLSILFWNLENYFDFTDTGAGDSDAEFSSGGQRRWTKGRFWKKTHGIAKTIMWTGEKYGRMPDVAGFAEVENGRVLDMLVNGTLLWKFGYAVVHEDSPDIRGIDVALVYRRDSFRMKSWKTFAVDRDIEGKPFTTRDILLVSLEEKACSGRVWHFVVNHHPSKYGGEKVSEARRAAAMAVLASVCDSLAGAGERNIVAMGDFNDTPEGMDYGRLIGKMKNLAVSLHKSGHGTIRYGGRWEMIDMFLVSQCLECDARMEVCMPPFLLVKDNAYSGFKPFRTYTGPAYSGGLSDHLPVILTIHSKTSFDGKIKIDNFER